MPSALEKLVKILKLEQSTGCQNKAVIGGLSGFGPVWSVEAHTQAKKPEHHALVDELTALIIQYDDQPDPEQRANAIKHMLGRITGRIPPANAPNSGTANTNPLELVVQQTTLPIATLRTDYPDVSSTKPEARATPPPVERRKPTPPPPAAPPRRDPPLPRPAVAPPVVKNEAISPFDQGRFEAPPVQPDRYGAAPASNDYQPTLDDLILEPVFALESPELIAARLPKVPARPPKRRRDNRPVEEKLSVWQALKQPVTTLPGIGVKMAEKLATMPIATVEDALNAFPRRYDDYTAMNPLGRLRPGELVSAMGLVRNVAEIKGKRGIDALRVVIEDGTGTLSVSFFNQSYLRGKFQRGAQVVFSGKTDLYLGKISMTNPHWEYVDQEALTTRAIVPVYPLTSSLSPANMRRVTDAALSIWGEKLPDPLPESVLDRADLAEYSWTIRQMHRPESMELLEVARRRLVFDELLLLQLGVLRNRRLWQSVPADPLAVSNEWLTTFEAALPYKLTNAQTEALTEIRADLKQSVPMNRLLQGDVGSGKTVVATAAMLIAVANQHQAALMAPTSILAEQHYRTVSRLISALPDSESIPVRLLTGATSTAERNAILADVRDGRVAILIGTHALIEDTVQFARLGMAVIDEQHRFGVEQRGRLRGKGTNPHLLVMTATPIPRTLALTVHADLDLSILDELPPGRTPIETRVLKIQERERAYSFVRAEIEQGRQAFVVYPLVEDSKSEAMAEVRSATVEYERLRTEVFPDLKLGLLHGRLSANDKDGVMGAFSAGETQILVSTSVIEVGIDVPNASVIIIEGANRFGLAQLHQFRGRVGRGQHTSFCLLIPDDSADPAVDNPRLMAMQTTTDGFKLAEIDWKLRGAGDLLGTRQSGGVGTMAEFITSELVELAQNEARAIYADDPMLTFAENRLLRARLQMVYGDDPGTELS
jgi:ATP-dependent DNA helicase RecG